MRHQKIMQLRRKYRKRPMKKKKKGYKKSNMKQMNRLKKII
jgi:hypothetical protein